MATAWTDLREYVGGLATDEAYLKTCLATATALVTSYIGAPLAETDVPEDVVDSALLEVGSKLFARQQAPTTHAMGDTLGGGGMLVAKDPMVTAYPILNRFIVAGLG